VYPVVSAAGGDGNTGLRDLSLALAGFAQCRAPAAMIAPGAIGPLAQADRAAIVTALLTGKAIRTGVFPGLPRQQFRHVDLTGDPGHLNERHDIS